MTMLWHGSRPAQDALPVSVVLAQYGNLGRIDSTNKHLDKQS